MRRSAVVPPIFGRFDKAEPDDTLFAPGVGFPSQLPCAEASACAGCTGFGSWCLGALVVIFVAPRRHEGTKL